MVLTEALQRWLRFSICAVTSYVPFAFLIMSLSFATKASTCTSVNMARRPLVLRCALGLKRRVIVDLFRLRRAAMSLGAKSSLNFHSFARRISSGLMVVPTMAAHPRLGRGQCGAWPVKATRSCGRERCKERAQPQVEPIARLKLRIDRYAFIRNMCVHLRWLAFEHPNLVAQKGLSRSP